MSPLGTLQKGRISGVSDKNSPSKFGSTLKPNKKDLKGATFNGFSNKDAFTDLNAHGENKGFSNTADLGALAKNNKMRRSYLSEGEMAKSFEFGSEGYGQGGEEEEKKSYDGNYDYYSNSRGLQNFSGAQRLSSSQYSNNQDRPISEDSMNQRHEVSGKA